MKALEDIGVAPSNSTPSRHRKKVRRPRPARGEVWGILNPFGDFWTYETFETAEQALAYVERFWAPFQSRPDTSEFQAVRAKVTVSALSPQPGDS